VKVVLLGTAAGGGFPQWNCWCPTCRLARHEPRRARPRTQSSLAVSADGRRWFLCNASPDVREQLTRLLTPGENPRGVRHVPIEGILLTDAELDHSLGVALLREARSMRLYATRSVLGTLERDSRILPVTRAFSTVDVVELQLDRETDLHYRDGVASGLSVAAFTVPGDPPRFARDDEPGHTVGLMITDRATGGRCAFVPGCGALDVTITDRLGTATALLFDGTFWSENELIELGISDRTATQIGHVPVSGDDGSLHRLASLPASTKVYTHINNTNPMLVEDGEARRQVERAGFRVGEDGDQLEF